MGRGVRQEEYQQRKLLLFLTRLLGLLLLLKNINNKSWKHCHINYRIWWAFIYICFEKFSNAPYWTYYYYIIRNTPQQARARLSGSPRHQRWHQAVHSIYCAENWGQTSFLHLWPTKQRFSQSIPGVFKRERRKFYVQWWYLKKGYILQAVQMKFFLHAYYNIYFVQLETFANLIFEQMNARERIPLAQREHQ